MPSKIFATVLTLGLWCSPAVAAPDGPPQVELRVASPRLAELAMLAPPEALAPLVASELEAPAPLYGHEGVVGGGVTVVAHREGRFIHLGIARADPRAPIGPAAGYGRALETLFWLVGGPCADALASLGPASYLDFADRAVWSTWPSWSGRSGRSGRAATVDATATATWRLFEARMLCQDGRVERLYLTWATELRSPELAGLLELAPEPRYKLDPWPLGVVPTSGVGALVERWGPPFEHDCEGGGQDRCTLRWRLDSFASLELVANEGSGRVVSMAVEVAEWDPQGATALSLGRLASSPAEREQVEALLRLIEEGPPSTWSLHPDGAWVLGAGAMRTAVVTTPAVPWQPRLRRLRFFLTDEPGAVSRPPSKAKARPKPRASAALDVERAEVEAPAYPRWARHIAGTRPPLALFLAETWSADALTAALGPPSSGGERWEWRSRIPPGLTHVLLEERLANAALIEIGLERGRDGAVMAVEMEATYAHVPDPNDPNDPQWPARPPPAPLDAIRPAMSLGDAVQVLGPPTHVEEERWTWRLASAPWTRLEIDLDRGSDTPAIRKVKLSWPPSVEASSPSAPADAAPRGSFVLREPIGSGRGTATQAASWPRTAAEVWLPGSAPGQALDELILAHGRPRAVSRAGGEGQMLRASFDGFEFHLEAWRASRGDDVKGWRVVRASAAGAQADEALASRRLGAPTTLIPETLVERMLRFGPPTTFGKGIESVGWRFEGPAGLIDVTPHGSGLSWSWTPLPDCEVELPDPADGLDATMAFDFKPVGKDRARSPSVSGAGAEPVPALRLLAALPRGLSQGDWQSLLALESVGLDCLRRWLGAGLSADSAGTMAVPDSIISIGPFGLATLRERYPGNALLAALGEPIELWHERFGPPSFPDRAEWLFLPSDYVGPWADVRIRARGHELTGRVESVDVIRGESDSLRGLVSGLSLRHPEAGHSAFGAPDEPADGAASGHRSWRQGAVRFDPERRVLIFEASNGDAEGLRAWLAERGVGGPLVEALGLEPQAVTELLERTKPSPRRVVGLFGVMEDEAIYGVSPSPGPDSTLLVVGTRWDAPGAVFTCRGSERVCDQVELGALESFEAAFGGTRDGDE